MPASYQATKRGDDEQKTYSQSASTNSATETATVANLMNGKKDAVFSIRPQSTLKDAVMELRDKRIGALLVRDANGELIGILSERDIVRKLADTPGETLPKKVEDIMTKSVEVCAPGDTLVSVLRRMTAGHFRHMPVQDGSNLIGMLTIGDVINYRLTELEHEALQLKQLIVG
ncbi:MAG: CBS domain-containing protein [Pseudomonadota bacterium]